MTSSNPSLRRVIKMVTGQDITRCQGCLDCDLSPSNDQDLALGSLVQLILIDEEEALHSRTLWSESALKAAQGACSRGLDLEAIIHILRSEAKRREIWVSPASN